MMVYFIMFFFQEMINILGTTITDLYIELKVKTSRIKYLASRLTR